MPVSVEGDHCLALPTHLWVETPSRRKEGMGVESRPLNPLLQRQSRGWAAMAGAEALEEHRMQGRNGLERASWKKSLTI